MVLYLTVTFTVFILGIKQKNQVLQVEKCFLNAGNGLEKIMPASFTGGKFL
jgi:hypothetical protein